MWSENYNKHIAYELIEEEESIIMIMKEQIAIEEERIAKEKEEVSVFVRSTESRELKIAQERRRIVEEEMKILKEKERIAREKERITREEAKIEKLKETFRVREQNILKEKQIIAVHYGNGDGENCKITSFREKGIVIVDCGDDPAIDKRILGDVIPYATVVKEMEEGKVEPNEHEANHPDVVKEERILTIGAERQTEESKEVEHGTCGLGQNEESASKNIFNDENNEHSAVSKDRTDLEDQEGAVESVFLEKQVRQEETIRFEAIRKEILPVRPISKGANDTADKESHKTFIKVEVNEEKTSSKKKKGTKHKKVFKYKCTICNKSLSPTQLLQHQASHSHVDIPAKHFKCEECSATFSNGCYLKKHEKTHARKKFKCDHCSKSYMQERTLALHAKTHRPGYKPFQCEQCPVAFSDRRSLLSHQWQHAGKVPFKCDLCEKSFYWKRSLVEHMRTHSGERPFECKVCSKTFTRSGDLISHNVTHSGERKYHCDKCDMSFMRPHHLSRHKNVHLVEKPYKCEKCEKSFFQAWQCKKHLKTHEVGAQKENTKAVAPQTLRKLRPKGGKIDLETCEVAFPSSSLRSENSIMHERKRGGNIFTCSQIFPKSEETRVSMDLNATSRQNSDQTKSVGSGSAQV